MNIKRQQQLYKVKNNLSKYWYKLVYPLAWIIEKVIQLNKIHNKKKISKWTDEYAVRKFAKLWIKNKVNAQFRTYTERFDICSYSYDEYNEITTIVTEMYNSHNKNISKWVYSNVHMYNFEPDINKLAKVTKLTELFKQELDKYPEIECKWINLKETNHNKYWCYGFKDYKKSLEVKFLI